MRPRKRKYPRRDPKMKQVVAAAYKLGLAGLPLPAQTHYQEATEAAYQLGLLDGGYPPWN